MAEDIASLFLDSPNWWDKIFRKVKDVTYVVEYQWKDYGDYGEPDQKRHQRRYKEFRNACRRLSYIIMKYEPEKAFILNFPVDLQVWRKIGLEEHATCSDCGGHNWRVK